MPDDAVRFHFDLSYAEEVQIWFSCPSCDVEVRTDWTSVYHLAEPGRKPPRPIPPFFQFACLGCGEVYEMNLSAPNGIGTGVVGELPIDTEVVVETLTQIPPDWEDLDGVPESAQISNLVDSLSFIGALTKERRSEQDEFAISVMLHSHCIAALERFLSSKFIATTLNRPKILKQHVEREPAYKEKMIRVSEIYKERSNLRNNVARDLDRVLYHRVDQVRKMYRRTFGIEFGDVGWLEKAVQIRHDCVHRAGHDTYGAQVDVTFRSVDLLCRQCMSLAEMIEERMSQQFQ